MSRNSKRWERPDFQVDLVLLPATTTPRAHCKAVNRFLGLMAGFWYAPATMIGNLCHVIAALGSPWIPLEPSPALTKNSRLAMKGPPRAENLRNFSSISLPVLPQSDDSERQQWSPWEMSLLCPYRWKFHPLSQKNGNMARFSFISVSISVHTRTDNIPRPNSLLKYTKERHLMPFRCSSRGLLLFSVNIVFLTRHPANSGVDIHEAFR